MLRINGDDFKIRFKHSTYESSKMLTDLFNEKYKEEVELLQEYRRLELLYVEKRVALFKELKDKNLDFLNEIKESNPEVFI